MACIDVEAPCPEGPTEEETARRKRRFGGLAVAAIAVVVLLAALLSRGPSPEHAFLRTTATGAPVSYPCQPIHVVVDSTDAPSDWRQTVDDALAELRSVSGYDVSLSDDQHPDGPVVDVSWSDEEQDPSLDGDVLGLGGSTVDATDASRYTDGFVLLDTRGSGTYTPEDREATLLHELGHVLGLDHVDSPAEIMSTKVRRTISTTYGPGDTEGLQQLHEASCG